MAQDAAYTLPEEPFRSFVALDIGDHVRAALASAILRLQRDAPRGVFWVPPGNLHVSMAFLGDVAPGTASLVCRALEDAAAATAAFSAEAAGVGCFGNPSRPRVLWAGVEGGDALTGLYDRVSRGLTECGCALDDRPFRGHITLGRVKAPRLPERLLRHLGEASQEAFGEFRVGALDLMRSTLSPRGARYERLRRFELRGDAPFR